ncbi:MAG TPA: benzoate/H(+) symporter BenE family transporter [Nakamurella sp.]
MAAERPRRARLIEAPPRPLTGWRRLATDFGAPSLTNGFIAIIFSVSGPVAVILAVGTQGGLGNAELTSWVFGVFVLNGLLTILACWLYRLPMAFFWTIPGTVLVGPALSHLSWPEIVGAFMATGIFMFALGLTGWVGRLMSAIPLSIVMGMVAGVFLRFGTGLVTSVQADVWIAAPMIVTWVLLSALHGLGRYLPPIIGALVVGVVMVVVLGRFEPAPGPSSWLAQPVLVVPQWSIQAMVELVIPLAITVLVVQNGQGLAVLRTAGHTVPINVVTLICGAWSVLVAAVGGVCTCLTGPTNALLVSSGERTRQYTAGIVNGLLAIGFGLFAPLITRAMLGMPPAFVGVLAGLAMLRVLQVSFVTAFGGRCSLGALVTFIVTVSDITIANIGAAFWGLVAGMATSLILERQDFKTHREES